MENYKNLTQLSGVFYCSLYTNKLFKWYRDWLEHMAIFSQADGVVKSLFTKPEVKEEKVHMPESDTFNRIVERLNEFPEYDPKRISKSSLQKGKKSSKATLKSPKRSKKSLSPKKNKTESSPNMKKVILKTEENIVHKSPSHHLLPGQTQKQLDFDINDQKCYASSETHIQKRAPFQEYLSKNGALAMNVDHEYYEDLRKHYEHLNVMEQHLSPNIDRKISNEHGSKLASVAFSTQNNKKSDTLHNTENLNSGQFADNFGKEKPFEQVN